MTGFFNTVANAAEIATVTEGDASQAIWMLITGVALALAWVAFFDKYWTAYSLNPTKQAQREYHIAIFAPVTLPILAVLLVITTIRNIRSVSV